MATFSTHSGRLIYLNFVLGQAAGMTENVMMRHDQPAQRKPFQKRLDRKPFQKRLDRKPFQKRFDRKPLAAA